MNNINKKQPNSLVRLCTKQINKLIPNEDSISQLCIPFILKKYLTRFYLEDKYMCEELLPPLEPDEMTCWFEEPFMNISNDEFLTIMNWNYGIPYFAYERNHVKYIYYTVDDGIDRYCWECAYTYLIDIAQYKIDKWASCEFEFGDTLIACLQEPNLWCSRCMTRSLFWIENWTWNTDHLNFRCLELLNTHHV